MAVATNFKPTGDIRVLIGTEVTFGTATLGDGTAVWEELPVTSFTLPEVASAVEVSAHRSGSYTQLKNQAIHRPDTQVYTFDLTLKGTPKAVEFACQMMFEDGTSECDFTGNYAFPSTYKDGTGSTSQSTILFENAGGDSTNVDMVCKSCIATGMELTEDIGSEAGELMVTLNLMTAYQPIYSNFADVENVTYTSGSYTEDTATPKNIKNLDFLNCHIGSTDVLVSKWSIAFSRTVERVSYSEATNYDPFGYAMTGTIEATGSITVKRDSNTHGIISSFKNSTSTAILLKETTATDLTIDCPAVLIDGASIDSGGSTLWQEVPFRCMGNPTSTGDSIVGILIA